MTFIHPAAGILRRRRHWPFFYLASKPSWSLARASGAGTWTVRLQRTTESAASIRYCIKRAWFISTGACSRLLRAGLYLFSPTLFLVCHVLPNSKLSSSATALTHPLHRPPCHLLLGGTCTAAESLIHIFSTLHILQTAFPLSPIWNIWREKFIRLHWEILVFCLN